MSLGILVPEGRGLNADQAYLPTMVQGVLVANFSKYSAISVLDRVSLDRVISETLDPTYVDNFDLPDYTRNEERYGYVFEGAYKIGF